MVIGIAGKPFSKIQIAIGILQFCVYWGFLRYIWAFAWSLFIIWKGITSSQPGSQQAQVQENNSGYSPYLRFIFCPICSPWKMF